MLCFLLLLTMVCYCMGFPGGSDGKESACNAGDLGSISGWEDSLGKGIATHSSILAWRPWTEEPDKLQSMGSQCQTRLGDSHTHTTWVGFPGGSVVKNQPANIGDKGLIPGLGRSPEGGNGNPLQYSCLGNPIERRAWQTTVHGAAKELGAT